MMNDPGPRAPHAARRAAALLAALAPLTTSALAAACPGCEPGLLARQRVLDEEPLTWLLVSLAPFALIALLGAALHRIGRGEPG